MAEARDFRYVGTRPIRPDGVDKVTGRANYGADFAMPGMLYGAVVRSPHAHANVVSIDTSGALALDGVRAVVTGADFPSVAPGEIEGAKARVTTRTWRRTSWPAARCSTTATRWQRSPRRVSALQTKLLA